MGDFDWKDYPYITRATNALRAELGDDRFFAECKASMVWPFTRKDLHRIPNLGKQTIKSIEETLKAHGGRLLKSGEPHPVSTLRDAANHAAQIALRTLKHCGKDSVKDVECVLQYSIHGEQVTEIPPEHQPHINGAIHVTIEFL